MGKLSDSIDEILPQTQCGQCGYCGCKPYADAIAAGEAAINQCPPGGAAGIAKLAALLERPAMPLNPANGEERPRTLARIDTSRCIGCTLCIRACPVDAIIGAPGFLHAVIDDYCTGCDLCIPPCPVDCIERVAAEPVQGAWSAARASASRARHQKRKARLLREQEDADTRLARYSREVPGAAGGKSAAAQAALARARARKLRQSGP